MLHAAEVRLSPQQIAVIREETARLDPAAKIFLFGSRANDRARGGDIDLLVRSERIGLAEKLLLKVRILERIGWQQLDLVVHPASQPAPAWIEAIGSEAQEL